MKRAPSGKAGKGLRKLPKTVRKKMGYMKKGGTLTKKAKGYKKGGVIPKTAKGMKRGGVKMAKGMRKCGVRMAKGKKRGGKKTRKGQSMRSLISNVPYFKVWVRREFTANHQDYHGEFLQGLAIALN